MDLNQVIEHSIRARLGELEFQVLVLKAELQHVLVENDRLRNGNGSTPQSTSEVQQ